MSLKIRNYVSSVYGMEIIRCCVPNWKVEIYEEKMPAGILRDSWKALPHTAEFALGDAVWPLCANCSNIIEECHPDVAVHSLWELIDANFSLPGCFRPAGDDTGLLEVERTQRSSGCSAKFASKNAYFVYRSEKALSGN